MYPLRQHRTSSIYLTTFGIKVCSVCAFSLNYVHVLTEITESFLPWDFDALFVSTTILILIHFIDFSLVIGTDHLDKAFTLFEYMIAAGNDIAAHRITEMRRLDTLLAEHASASRQQAQESTGAVTTTIDGNKRLQRLDAAAHPQPHKDSVSPDGNSPQLCDNSTVIDLTDGGSILGDDLTAEQILALAESMDIEATDWLGLCEQACIV